jgi:hypothetical protein
VCILEEIARQQKAKRAELSEVQRQWLAEATSALAVPETLVKTMSEYSHDPQVLYEYRDKLGDLIDRSGVADANPWGDNFGDRGFPEKHRFLTTSPKRTTSDGRLRLYHDPGRSGDRLHAVQSQGAFLSVSEWSINKGCRRP